MSNEDLVADNGYAYVSIAVQYNLVGVSAMRSDDMRGSDKPMHLLTNFVIVEMVEANENDTEDAKSEYEEEKDTKDDR